MKTPLITLLFLAAITNTALAEASGNLAYAPGYSKSRPEENERNKRVLSSLDIPPGSNTMFLEASVLMNVKADEYMAVFAVTQEAETPADCNQKMDRTVNEFSAALKPLGIGESDLFVDFVAQNKTYGYRVDNNVAKEELAGFELKKNISVHYRDKLLLDRLVLGAAQAKIFDLVKVDYIVRDTESVQDRLMQEATEVIKRKEARYQKLLGIHLLPPPQVYAEKPSIYYPSEMYQSYAAYESEQVDRDLYRSKYLVQDMRKSRTFFFNPLSPDGFDNVVNPVVLEPVVQFTLYLKVKYDIDLRRGKK
jgi:uncharacterized protein YggE